MSLMKKIIGVLVDMSSFGSASVIMNLHSVKKGMVPCAFKHESCSIYRCFRFSRKGPLTDRSHLTTTLDFRQSD